MIITVFKTEREEIPYICPRELPLPILTSLSAAFLALLRCQHFVWIAFEHNLIKF